MLRPLQGKLIEKKKNQHQKASEKMTPSSIDWQEL